MVVGWVLSQGLLKGRDRDKEQAVSGAQPQHISLLWLLGSGVALGALGSGSVLPSHPEGKHRAHGKGPRTLLGVLQLPASACCRRDTDWRIAPEGIGDPTLPHQCDRGRWSPLGTEVLATPWRQDLEAGLLRAPPPRQALQWPGLPQRAVLGPAGAEPRRVGRHREMADPQCAGQRQCPAAALRG